MRAAIVLVLLAALAAAPSAQTLDAWLAAHADQAAYGSIADTARSLAASLAQAGLSDSLIADRLAEASKKRVPASTLAPILEGDARRYLALASSLRGLGLLSSEPKKASEAVEQASLLLRAGIPEPALGAALAHSAAKLGTGPGSGAFDRAMAALSVAATILAEYRISQTELLTLVTGLVDSDLSTAKIPGFAATLRSAVKKGLSVDQAIGESLGKVTRSKAQNPGEEKGNEEKTGKSGKGKGKR